MICSDKEVISIDIDGVLAATGEDYSSSEVVCDARYALCCIRAMGYLIYLNTARHILRHEDTKKWLDDNCLVYDLIIYGKPVAKYYVDDRAIKFDNWANVLEQIDDKPL